MEKQLLREFPSGQKVWNFNPASDIPDAPDVNEGMRVVMMQKGMTLETAQHNVEQRRENMSRRANYHEVVPCIACCGCIVVREMRNGKLENTVLACSQLKRLVSRYGTCDDGRYGKTGPLVLEKDMTMAEIEANKSKLIN